MTRKKRVGVIGSFVWDVIHGRDPRDAPVEEWGGITYALGALEAAQLIRQHFRGPIYCDLHSLLLAVQPDGMRTLQPLPNPAAWCRCFDFIQVNDDEMSMMTSDPMALATIAFAEGVSFIAITLGSRGVIYFAASGFERLADMKRSALGPTSGPIRTARVPAKTTRFGGRGDPTGCGDVWGATYFSRLLAGDKLDAAIDRALDAAARNVDHRGATGLADYLRGELSIK